MSPGGDEDQMQRYKFTIKGVTPLLLHHNNIEERDRITDLRKKLKSQAKGDDRSPAESWKGYVYVSDDTGNICLPAENLQACMLAGGAKCRLRGKETLKTHSQRIGFDRLDYDLVVGGRTIAHKDIDKISGEFTEHADAARKLGFRLHVKPCRIGTSSHVRVRPWFSGWSVSGVLEISPEDEEVLGLSALRDLFAACGRLVGLGDWRPGSPKPGQYGRFTSTVERA